MPLSKARRAAFRRHSPVSRHPLRHPSRPFPVPGLVEYRVVGSYSTLSKNYALLRARRGPRGVASQH